MTQNQKPVPGSPEWKQDLDEEDVSEMMALNGDEIMAELGRKRDANGDWSEEDLAILEAECRRRLSLIGE